MFRAALLVLAGVLLAAAAIAFFADGPWPFVMWGTVLGVMLVTGVLFERGRYKPTTPDHPGPGWVKTDERFVDPESGEEVTVYYQPSSGQRRYVGR